MQNCPTAPFTLHSQFHPHAMIDNLFLVVVALGLVALNGFFVAAEFGIVKLRSTRVSAIARISGLPGRIPAKVHADLDAYLSACQLGITLDNMLATLVGEIRDEFLQSSNDWTLLDDGTLLGKGSLPIFTLERALGIGIELGDETENIGSIGGLIMWKLGSVPTEGSRIAFEQFDAVVKKMHGPRIVLVRIYPKTTDKSQTQVSTTLSTEH